MTNITELQASYHYRMKDLIPKAPSAACFCKAFFSKFSFPSAAQVFVLLLLFSPSLFSQANPYKASENAGTSQVPLAISQNTNLYSILQAPAGEKYQAMTSLMKGISKGFPGEKVSNPFKIRRTRGLLSKTDFHVISGVVSNISFINNGLRFPDTGNPPWQFYKRPPGTIFKIRI